MPYYMTKTTRFHDFFFVNIDSFVKFVVIKILVGLWPQNLL